MRWKMIREEAIKIWLPVIKMGVETMPECKEALDMAIEALEQEPCEDAISREELLKTIDTWDKFGCDADTKLVPYQDHYIPYIHYDDVVKCIKGMPSVTSQEPKTGHWIEKQEKEDCEPFILWECSNCHNTVLRGHFRKYSYCPNCGAKMVKPHESEVNNG